MRSDRRGALFLAEVVRRHQEMREKWPETPVRTPVLPPRSAWSAEARACIEAYEGQGGQAEALVPRRPRRASVTDGVTQSVTASAPPPPQARAYSEACEDQGGQAEAEALVPRGRGVYHRVHAALLTA